jgi:hypothetical protein
MDTIPDMVEKENLTIRIDKPLREKLDQLAAEDARSVASMVRVLLMEAIKAREGR